MKKLILSGLVCLFASFSFGQIAYYDAARLASFIDRQASPPVFKNDRASLVAVSEVLLKYCHDLPDNTDYHNVISAITTNNPGNNNYNPFIAPYLNVAVPLGVTNISAKSILADVGNLDVTSIADEFAKFLVKRTREEMNVAFFDRLKTFLEKHKDAMILFPQTYATLQAIGDEVYNYQAYMNSLREAFEKDLTGLLTSLPDVINNSDYTPFFNKHGELKDACLSSVYIGNGLLNKVHPGQIIAGYDPGKLLASQPNNVKAAVKVLQVFSESVRSRGTSQYWIPADSLQMVMKDDLTLRLYLGLVYQEVSGIRLDDNTTIQEKFGKSIAAIHDFDTYLTGFVAKAAVVSANIKNLSGREQDKLTFTDYFNFYNASLDLIGYAAEAYQLPGLAALKPPKDFNRYMIIGRTGGNIALDINRKNYSSAVINVYTLYNTAFGGDNGKLESIISDKTKTPEEQKAAASLLEDRKLLNGKTDDFKNSLLKFGSFMASVVQAQNADEVEKAIETAALPSGSSRIKRETPFNVSLNAYTGLFVAHEMIVGVNDKHMINNYGVAAPIGVAISTGVHHWSYSAFISLVDIGAVASFRFQNSDSVAQVPTIKLQDIFSPGLFLSIGLPKCPLSFNLGAQVGPNLRSVYVEDKKNPGTYINSYQDNVYWRFSAALVVDIPVFNFYTKSKK
ncbi:MAG: hypothetical protein NT040_01780 [Bacteroidetes bacterium]|nr:hypothetical protein [Bacteroidota bacterium]